ncbi:hypothetical protein TRIATDRAFT_301088 [Trichoderma atroviride IMI 206040]|uniref:Uncharacterized protein n=1 Tax=Hypocrea atroviridis (strain ATCC 20476 / IMI 206040) TaxID=452589 RepID=G9P0M5_HYPAI|nr:uncharacterized protein TRIATDRAFT_301088 [Trichoderma atroviride IMI 206040]EHK43176.1 hypothetical protein TRIATDRAFT_301088 [Trichoderma atroviride IMI 206040]
MENPSHYINLDSPLYFDITKRRPPNHWIKSRLLTQGKLLAQDNSCISSENPVPSTYTCTAMGRILAGITAKLENK